MEGRPLEQPGESALVERARHGDQSAYGELVTRHQAVAARVAYVITASAADAEDVAQDAFVKASYALDRSREGWLAVDLEDTGCRFGMKRRGVRTA